MDVTPHCYVEMSLFLDVFGTNYGVLWGHHHPRCCCERSNHESRYSTILSRSEGLQLVLLLPR